MFPAVVVYRSRLSLSFLSSSTFYFHFYTFHFISLCFLSSALLSSLATFLSYRLVYSVIFFLRYSLFLFRVTTACISVLSHRCSKRMRSWSIINVLSAPFSILNFGNAHRRGLCTCNRDFSIFALTTDIPGISGGGQFSNGANANVENGA